MEREPASTSSAGTESKKSGPITHQPIDPPSCAVSETTSSVASPKSTSHSPKLESPSKEVSSADASTPTTPGVDTTGSAPAGELQPASIFSSHIIVRDFAYAETHPLYHGPPANPNPSNPKNDDELADGSGRQDTEGSRPAPDWNPDAMYDNTLPPTSFGDGPPYSEDEDLHSPILITTRRRRSKGMDGRIPDVAGEFDNEKGIFVSDNGDGTETYYMPDEDALEDGPGGEYVTYDDWQEDDSRLSRDFHFAITSPDEEMHGKAIALFDFQSMHENELPLREGQVILVSYRHGEGWLVAEDPKTGESGLVPEAYVRLARHIEGGLNSLNGEQGFENDTPQHADVNGEEEEGGEGEDDGDSQVLETPASQKTGELKELQGDANNDIPKEEQDGSKATSDDRSKGQGKRKPSPIDCTKDMNKCTELGVNGSAK